MYKNPFYLTSPIWNNVFSYEKRENKQLYIPSLIEINNFDDIELWEEVAFEDYWFDWKLSTNKWLKNFYKIIPHLTSPQGIGITAPIYLFDNHNHAFYFWYLARNEWTIWDDNTLIHIDEHADTRDNNKYLSKEDSQDLEKVYQFTNEVLNVGDYIIPAQEEWIIWDIIQIRNETNLNDYLNNLTFPKGVPEVWGGGIKKNGQGIILNLDLDFFQPDLDFIDYDLKKKVVLDAASKASVITIASSPFFINQELAIRVFKDIFQ